MRRLGAIIRIGLSWIAGFVLYMILMIMTTYDGVLSLLLQPIMAALFSSIFLSIALIVGFILRIPALGKYWNNHKYLAGIIFLLGFILYFFSESLGFTVQSENNKTGLIVNIPNPMLVYGGYFLMIFSLAKFPMLGYKKS